MSAPSIVRKAAGPMGVFGGFIGVWYLVAGVVLPPQKRFLLPYPHEVLREGFFVWHTGERRGLQPILLSTWDSAKVALAGLALTVVVGTALALLMSLSTWVERATWPYLVAVQSAPILALTPLIRALVDGVTTQRVLVVVLISVFPVVSNTLFGLLAAGPAEHDLFTLWGASRWQRVTRLQFPAALPSIFVGLRIAAGLSVIGAVVGDFYFRHGGTVGIGAQIDVYRSRLWGPELITAIIMASLLGMAVFAAFGWIQRLTIGRWHVPGGTARDKEKW